jgi:hyperosmotically inducible protein
MNAYSVGAVFFFYTRAEGKNTGSASSHHALLSLLPSPTERSTPMKQQILARSFTAALALAFAGFTPLAVDVAYANDNNAKADSDQPVTDTWITTKVKAELATTEGVKSNDITVKTVDGVVTLTGVVGTSLAAQKAVAAAESVKGVKKVDHSGLKSQ